MSNSFVNTKFQYDSSVQGSNIKISQDKAQLNRESVTPFDISSAKLSYQQGLNTLADAKHNLSNYSITAPFTGALTTFTSNVGDYISQGSKVGTLVTNKKIIKIFINETDILKTHLSQKAEITTDSIPDIKIEGEIIDIDTLPTIDGGVVTYAAKVAVNSDDERLRIGLTTNIYIKIKEKGPVLNIATSAIKSDNRGKYVEVLDKNPITNNIKSSSSDMIENKRFVGNVPVVGNTTHNIYIETGETIGNNTEIISGLNEGDIVIVNKISTTASDDLLDDKFAGPGKNRNNKF
ncbi:MAG: HlyD family efflux transporter periplasmic adaptor subunit [Candidatus Pacebacteria bacterium]|nr:HlyD family efflux transporter periplasmic adaptor subunit [Candidatus Paceibacterota bacterium]